MRRRLSGAGDNRSVLLEGRDMASYRIGSSWGLTVLAAILLLAFVAFPAHSQPSGTTAYYVTDGSAPKYGRAAVSWQVLGNVRISTHQRWRGATDGCNGSDVTGWNARRLSYRKVSVSWSYWHDYPTGTSSSSNCAQSAATTRVNAQTINSTGEDFITNLRFVWHDPWGGWESSTRFRLTLSGAQWIPPY